MQTVEPAKTATAIQAKATQEEPFFAPTGRQTAGGKVFLSGSEAGGNGFFKPRHAVQTKLTIGQPGDKYEQEADRMAERGVSQPAVQRQTDGQDLFKEQQEDICIGWPVPVIRQPNPWGCWAASFAMMYVWKNGQPSKEEDLFPFEEGTPYTAKEIQENVGSGEYIDQYIMAALRAGTRSSEWTNTYQKNRKGLDNSNVNKFLEDTGLKAVWLKNPDNPKYWISLLKTGPLMVGALTEQKTGMHAQIIIGLEGGSDPQNTFFHINDPLRGGEQISIPFTDFVDRFKAGGKEFGAAQVYQW